MATKGMCSDDKTVIHSPDTFRTLLSSAIRSHGSAEVALLHIMKTHNFDTNTLQQILIEDRINLSFSNIKYEDIAPFVNLQPNRLGNDIKPFYVYRSRIPTSLFKSIVEDIDIMLVQYGPPLEHPTEEARSRFLAPIFNRLIALFGFAFRNLSEFTIEGRIITKDITKDRVEYYFETIGPIAVLFIEMMPKIGSFAERLDTIAQVIAQCNACDWRNAKLGFRVPVYGILCDGVAFEYFLFDGTAEPFSFKRGLRPIDPPTVRRPFVLPDIERPSTRPFIDTLRPICEVTFDLLLNGYVSSLETHHNRSVNQSAIEGGPRKSVDKWAEALSAAVRASHEFREADAKRQAGLIDEANAIVEVAMRSLKCSVDVVPIPHRPKLIMGDWDNEEVEKV